MKLTYTVATGGLALILALPWSAFADRGEASYYSPPTFSDLDFDANGVLDPGEVQGRTPLLGEWDRFDTNSDGLIEQSEFAAFETRQSEEPMTPLEAPLDSGSKR